MKSTNEINKLGNIYGFDGGSFAGIVFDTNYIFPALNTMQGGRRQPLILVKKGNKEKDSHKDND